MHTGLLQVADLIVISLLRPDDVADVGLRAEGLNHVSPCDEAAELPVVHDRKLMHFGCGHELSRLRQVVIRTNDHEAMEGRHELFDGLLRPLVLAKAFEIADSDQAKEALTGHHRIAAVVVAEDELGHEGIDVLMGRHDVEVAPDQ